MYSMLLTRVGTHLAPILCSGKSLWCSSVKRFCFFLRPNIQGDAEKTHPGETWSEYSMVKTETKVTMTCLNDVQNSPGKTILWTQQQHYTCAFKISRTSLTVN